MSSTAALFICFTARRSTPVPTRLFASGSLIHGRSIFSSHVSAMVRLFSSTATKLNFSSFTLLIACLPLYGNHLVSDLYSGIDFTSRQFHDIICAEIKVLSIHHTGGRGIRQDSPTRC